MDKQRESSRARRIRRTKVDWFGIIMMFVLLVCSLAIFARLMATKMLTTTNMVLIMVALLVVNGLHIFVQLPLRRNKLGKLICGVLAVVLSVVMIYGTVAAGAVQSALNKISYGAQTNPMPKTAGTQSVSSMMIANPFSARGFSKLFSTHPPTDERISRLMQMSQEMRNSGIGGGSSPQYLY